MYRYLFALLFLLCPFVAPPQALAAETSTIEWFTLFLGLFGGLALFLAGLEQLAEGLKKAAGATMKTMLSKLTSNRFMGAFTGATVTGILNSSSITTVLVVGFVTAGVMTLQQSVGVIMGANIGSTVTAQLLAFNISQYALLPIAVGFFMLFTSSKDAVRNYGMMIMGLGMVFFGMSIMSDSMYPLRSYDPFLELLQKMDNPLLAILAGALFTGLVQSSAATVGIAIAMASGGLLTLTTGIGLALGANIGTCITALMAAMGKPSEAIRASVVHVVFNVIGVLIWLPFISTLGSLAAAISPSATELEGTARLAAEVPRQIANANTIFNVINTVLFLPFTALFAFIANKLIKDKPTPEAAIQPLYLDNSLLEVPSMALEGVRRELTRAAEIIVEMIDRFRSAFAKANFKELADVVKEDDKIDILELASIEYLGAIRTRPLSQKESSEHQRLMTTAVTLESIADIIETDLMEIAKQAIESTYERSQKTRQMVQAIHQNLREAVNLLVPTIAENDLASARKIIHLNASMKNLQREFLQRKSERLRREHPEAMRIARLEVSAVDKMLRMYSLCKQVARVHLPDEN